MTSLTFHILLLLAPVAKIITLRNGARIIEKDVAGRRLMKKGATQGRWP
jgi:hypothetical protein